MKRRKFIKQTIGGIAGLTCSDFLSYFRRFGMPYEGRSVAMAKDVAIQADLPNFLIYWYIEGGWMGYDMFNPVMTPNNVLHRLDNAGKERYRVLKFNQDDDYRIQSDGKIRHGYLADEGVPLFKDLAVLSSMHTGSFHSGERLKTHMGDYPFRLTADREDDERSVMQAFAEVYGQPYLLPHLSWHRWLSDGELNEVQYTGRKGYYHALGPRHAHTIYAGTPASLRKMLLRAKAAADDVVNQAIQNFLDTPNAYLTDDKYSEAVRSYHSAREIYQHMTKMGVQLDGTMLSKLFTDSTLRDRFAIQPQDELITYRSVNGNKARSKFAPNVNVQALMTYEMLCHGLSCGFWIESRDIRGFDNHYTRSRLWKNGKPVGMPDQSNKMDRDLWNPLKVFVDLLKNTQYRDTGKSYFDHTTIVATSEFGRTIHGDIDAILKLKISDEEKKKKVAGQDISQHWKVTSAAFLGGKVKGHTQYGRVGEQTLQAIPLLPDGTMDPAYAPKTGLVIDGRRKNPKSQIPNHGDVYATALYLCDINPQGHGRNQRPPLRYIKRT